MKKYTGMYIVRPTATEEQISVVNADIEKIFVQNGGSFVVDEKWGGMRDLAYEIEDFNKGYYVKFAAEADVAAVEEFDRVCNIKEDVIRHILVKE